MSRVIHFELTADDPERATRFYQEVFGWQSNKWDGPQDYWLIKTGEECRHYRAERPREDACGRPASGQSAGQILPQP